MTILTFSEKPLPVRWRLSYLGLLAADIYSTCYAVISTSVF